jgi:DNA-binding transcriptional regulator/RsmH inhibitor MraZ
VAGQDGRIELWAEEVYARIDMPSDDFANLAEKLLGNPDTGSA